MATPIPSPQPHLFGGIGASPGVAALAAAAAASTPNGTNVLLPVGVGSAVAGPSSSTGPAGLGKDGDPIGVRTEVQRLVGEVERLEGEVEAIFREMYAARPRLNASDPGRIALTSRDGAFASDAAPSATAARLGALMESLAKLQSTLRTTGLGALPLSSSSEPGQYDLSTLIEAKQKEVQELYKERSRRREGAGIVGAAVAPRGTANEPFPTFR